MRRFRVLIASIVLMGAAWSSWELLWGRWPGASAERPSRPVLTKRAEPSFPGPAARKSGATGLFTFEHKGKTVTVDLEQVRRSHDQLVREAPEKADAASGTPDLDLSFLAWSGRRLQGEETIKTRKCWVIDFTNPDRPAGTGPYCMVRLFVDKELGALMRTMCYDWSEKRRLDYLVTRGRKVNGVLTVSRAEARHYEPEGRKVVQEVEYRLP